MQRTDCHVRRSIVLGVPVKKTYEKPVLTKREKLSDVVAKAITSLEL
jgi:hypothetical protein